MKITRCKSEEKIARFMTDTNQVENYVFHNDSDIFFFMQL